MEQAIRITGDPAIMVGKPCIEGTRLPVSHILQRLAEGMSVKEYAEVYRTDEKFVYVSLEYASRVISHKRLNKRKVLFERIFPDLQAATQDANKK